MNNSDQSSVTEQASRKFARRPLTVTAAALIALSALGLALGYWSGPNSAPALVNLVYFPMAICSGLWFPFPLLPKFLRQVGELLPAYHLSQIGLKILGLGVEGFSVVRGGAYLAGFTLAALALAWIGYRRDEGRTYG